MQYMQSKGVAKIHWERHRMTRDPLRRHKAAQDPAKRNPAAQNMIQKYAAAQDLVWRDREALVLGQRHKI